MDDPSIRKRKGPTKDNEGEEEEEDELVKEWVELKRRKNEEKAMEKKSAEKRVHFAESKEIEGPPIETNVEANDDDDDDEAPEEYKEGMRKLREKLRKEDEEEGPGLGGFNIVGSKVSKLSGESEKQTYSDEDDDDVEIEPFNLNEERKQGYFDEDFNFIRNKKEDSDEEDAWVDELEKQASQQRFKRRTKTERKNKENDKDDNDSDNDDNDDDDDIDNAKPLSREDILSLKKELITFLLDGENVLAALKRLSGRVGSTSVVQKKIGQKPPENGNTNSERDMEKFNRLTECADTLLGAGVYNIYNDKKEKLVKEVSSSSVGNRPGLPKVVTYWEYQVSDGTSFGPYSSETMASWRDSGYFSGNSTVLVRKANGNPSDDIFEEENEAESEWFKSDTIDFKAYL